MCCSSLVGKVSEAIKRDKERKKKLSFLGVFYQSRDFECWVVLVHLHLDDQGKHCKEDILSFTCNPQSNPPTWTDFLSK